MDKTFREKLIQSVFQYGVKMVSCQSSLFMGGTTPEDAENIQGEATSKAIDQIIQLIQEDVIDVIGDDKKFEVNSKKKVQKIKKLGISFVESVEITHSEISELKIKVNEIIECLNNLEANRDEN